jgi:hypothetical protein
MQQVIVVVYEFYTPLGEGDDLISGQSNHTVVYEVFNLAYITVVYIGKVFNLAIPFLMAKFNVHQHKTFY